MTSGGGGGTGGNKANNVGPPGTNNLGTLPAVATAVAPVYTEGNQVALSTDLAGKLRTDSTGGSGGASAIDEEAFVEGVTTFTPGGGVFGDALGVVAAGLLAVGRITSHRAHHVNLRAADGTEIGTVAAPVQIGAAALPLPTGAATEATLAEIDADLDLLATQVTLAEIAIDTDNLDAPLSTRATEATLALIKAKTDNLNVPLSDLTTPADIQPVSVASLPLPAGAATEATLAEIDADLDLLATEATLALIKAKTDNIDVALSTRTKPSDTQLVSAATLPLPSGAATEATLALVKAKTDNLDVLLSTRTKPADTQLVSAATLPLPTGAATEATLALVKAKTDNLDVLLSTRTKPSDTQLVSAASLPLPSGAATEATLATRLSESDFDTKVGSLTETAPATDTASSGLNGRLQRIAQRITSLIALLPAALVGGRLDVNLGAAPATVTVTGSVTTSGTVATTAADGTNVALGATTDVAASSDAGTFSLIALFKRLLGKFTTQFPAALVGGRLDVSIGASPATVPVSAVSLPLPTGAATEATLATRLSESDFDTKIGSLTETAPASDTASSGLNGRLQRIAQRLTSLIAQLPAALTGSGNLKVALVETTVTQPVSAAALPLPAGAATEATLALVKAKTDNLDAALSTRATEATLALIKAKTDNIDVALSTRTKPSDQQHVIVDSSALPSGAATETTLGTRLSESDFDTKIGSLTETAPATDTASSGLNGRLQRIAQRLTSLIAQLPAALVGGRFDVNIGSASATVPVSGTVAVSQPVAVTVANGADVALGAITDPEVAFGDGSAIAIAKHTRTMARSTRNVLARGLMSLGQQLPEQLAGGRLNVSLGAAPAKVTVRPDLNTVWDAGPINQEIVLFDSRPRTVTQITPDQVNTLYKGVMIWLRVTAAPVSPTGFLRISLQARDPVNLTTYLGLNAKTALVPISAAGGFAWMFYPGSAGDVFVANFSGIKDVISYPLPRVWRVAVVHSVPGEIYTYSLSATLMR